MRGKIVRGQPIPFAITFRDVNSAAVTVSSAILYVSYERVFPRGGRLIETLTMSNTSGNIWSASWDSSVAASGYIYWSARSANPIYAVDGKFELTANEANPDPTVQDV